MYTKKVLDGYFYRTMLYDKNLAFCPYGSCGVNVFTDGTIQLKSYSTIVCEIDKDGWFNCYGTFSRTTIKHISAFLKEYAKKLSYFDAKNCYLNNLTMNINTREVIDNRTGEYYGIA